MSVRSARGRRKAIEEEREQSPSNESAKVSKRFSHNKVKSNLKLSQKKQPKLNSIQVDVIDPSDSNENTLPLKGKKVREQSKTKINSSQNSITTDIQKEKDKKMRKRKSLNSAKEINGEVGQSKKAKKEATTAKGKRTKITVQKKESLEPDIDILTMHNEMKGRKTIKTLTPKKRVLEKDSNSVPKKQSKEIVKRSTKGKLVNQSTKKVIGGTTKTPTENSIRIAPLKEKGM